MKAGGDAYNNSDDESPNKSGDRRSTVTIVTPHDEGTVENEYEMAEVKEYKKRPIWRDIILKMLMMANVALILYLMIKMEQMQNEQKVFRGIVDETILKNNATFIRLDSHLNNLVSTLSDAIEISESRTKSKLGSQIVDMENNINDLKLRLETRVRLVGGGTFDGRLEIYYDSVWGTVCDDSWGTNEARVVCRMLGYKGTSWAVANAVYGAGSGQIWLDNVVCIGDESHIGGT